MTSLMGLKGSGKWLLLPLFILFGCNFAKKDSREIYSAADTVSAVSKNTAASNTPQHPVDTVYINNMKFMPEVIHAHKGDTIIWINNDMVAHCVTEAKNKTWSSLQLGAGDIWKKPVDQSDDYFCAIHLVMKGKIVVE